MGPPYGQDLRERVVDAAETTSRRQVAARFGVGVATAIRWMATLTVTGTVAARPQGRARRSKLDPHETFLRTQIAERDDMTLGEMRARLKDEHDLTVGMGTLWACAVGAEVGEGMAPVERTALRHGLVSTKADIVTTEVDVATTLEDLRTAIDIFSPPVTIAAC